MARYATPDLRQAQLPLDDTWIDRTLRVQRVWHEARKYPEPILTADRPWERYCPVAFGTVLRRQGRFQMWYCAWTRHIPPRACYAESDDGVTWSKPRLGLNDTLGSTDNNVVMVSQAADGVIDDLTVIDDPDDSRWPLKMLYWDSAGDSRGKRGHGICAARSKDGIAWESLGMVLPNWGDRFNALPVKHAGRYVVFGRAPGAGFSRGRTVYRTESRDLKRWTAPKLVMAADVEDPPAMEIYSLPTFCHEGLIIGGIERMHMSPDVLDTEIAWSRDAGATWRRSRVRPSFIARGAAGRFDSAWVNLTASQPIEQTNELWFYYSGRSAAHACPAPHNHGAIGLATLRRDGFCSIRAEAQPGEVLTTPLRWPGGDLLVNADCRRDITSHPHNFVTGELRVEARDVDGAPVTGYAAGECGALSINTIRHDGAYVPVRWAGDRSMNKLAGRTIRLAFQLRDAHLYGFRAGAAT